MFLQRLYRVMNHGRNLRRIILYKNIYRERERERENVYVHNIIYYIINIK